ncbi:MAG TPA: hypothetical protein VJB98_01185 [Candidatus Paceibacterota bacterium]
MATATRHDHFKIKIAISGAAETGHLTEEATLMAAELGREVVRQGAILVTGATTGIPLWAAKGAKEEGGTSIGISPALGEREHVEVYKLPLDYMDLIMFTGQGYSGRDILMTRSSDAVIICAGRIGTIHEFTVVFEDHKPLGILEGPWSTDDIIKEIIEKSNRASEDKAIVYDPDPKKLVEKVLKLVKDSKIEYYKTSKVT